MDPAIQIEGVAFEISQQGLDALINKRGVEVKVSSLNVQISAEALATLLRRFAPEAAVEAEVTTGGVVVQQKGDAGILRVELALPEIRVQTGDGTLSVRGEGTTADRRRIPIRPPNATAASSSGGER